jgi:hypothetical protein
MKYQKFNRYEKKEIKRNQVAEAMAGGGVYLYENSSPAAELTLPRPTRSGVRKLGPKQQFQGDSYYMQLVRAGMLRLIEVIQTEEQEREALLAEHNEHKLITDQPDRVTNKGKVENVVDRGVSKQRLHESDHQPQPDVLLNEGPSDGGFIIVQ